MNPNALAEALQDSPFANVLPPEVTQRLAATAKWKSCPRGTMLFREGQVSDAFYLILRGYVTLEMCLPAAGCTQLLTVGPGEVVAWSALVGEGQMTASAQATEDVDLIEFSGSALRQQCEADPQFGYHLMKQLAAALAKRLLATRLQMIDMFQADAKFASRGSAL